MFLRQARPAMQARAAIGDGNMHLRDGGAAGLRNLPPLARRAGKGASAKRKGCAVTKRNADQMARGVMQFRMICHVAETVENLSDIRVMLAVIAE